MELKRLRVLLTFDHELHLGGAESYRRNLFDPTERLLDLAQRVGVPLNFFTDVLCAQRFAEWDPRRFLDRYSAQITRMLREGHDPQLHIHPHWIETTYDGRRFDPSPKFALADFKDASPPNDIGGIVRRGKEFLVGLCRPIDDTYRCIAYRAGGYNLAPATSEILSALRDNGILIDSSIAKGYTFRSALSEVDYRVMPRKPNWTIAPTGPLDRPARSGILEVPIAAKRLTPINNLPYRLKQALLYKTIKRRRYRSGGFMIHTGKTSKLDKLRELLVPSSALMLGFDSATLSDRDLMAILKSYLDEHRGYEEITTCAISHPKVMGDYHRRLMERFVARARDRFGDRLEFVTYRGLVDDLGLGEPA